MHYSILFGAVGTLILIAAVAAQTTDNPGSNQGGSGGSQNSAAPQTPAEAARTKAQQQMSAMIEKIQKAYMDQCQKDLNMTDDDFKVITDKLTAQSAPLYFTKAPISDLITGVNPPVPRARDVTTADELQKALTELLKAERDPTATANVLAGKLEGVREVRRIAHVDLQTIRDDGRKVLTIRQEAMMMVYGAMD